MTRWDEGVFDPHLPAELVLREAEIGVIVADRHGNVLFVNEFAVRMLRLHALPQGERFVRVVAGHRHQHQADMVGFGFLVARR